MNRGLVISSAALLLPLAVLAGGQRSAFSLQPSASLCSHATLWRAWLSTRLGDTAQSAVATRSASLQPLAFSLSPRHKRESTVNSQQSTVNVHQASAIGSNGGRDARSPSDGASSFGIRQSALGISPPLNTEHRTLNTDEPTWHPQPFDRYTSILSRMPFGKPPPAPPAPTAAEQAAVAPPPPFANKLTLCAVNRRPEGMIAVGFVDNSLNPPKSYYLDKGETSDGFTVVDADIDSESSSIEKDGTTITLRLASTGTLPSMTSTACNPLPVSRAPTLVSTDEHMTTVSLSKPRKFAVDSGAVGYTPETLRDRLRSRMFSPDNPKGWPVPSSVKGIDAVLEMGIQQESYIERLKRRRDELAAQESARKERNDAESEAKSASALQANLRKQNLDNIRQGGSGLGIPLTVEEDAQLVKEGVLPPTN